MAGPDWKRVGDRVVKRMAELRIDQAELARRSGRSVPTVAGIIRGEPRSGSPRPSSLWGVSTALGWAQDSIADIAAGGEPTLAVEPSAGGVSPLDAAALAGRVDALEQAVVELTESVHRALRLAVRRPTASTESRQAAGPHDP